MTTAFVQYPLPDFERHQVGFQHGHEYRRFDQAQFRMSPPQKNFRSRQLPGRKIELRLKEQLPFVALACQDERIVDLTPGCDVSTHGLIEELDLAASASFCLKHRAVCQRNQFFGVIAVRRAERDAYAGEYLKAMPVHAEGLADPTHQAIHRILDVGQRSIGRHRNGELVSAQTPDDPRGGRDRLKPQRERLQQCITDRMAERIIDTFEIVQIDHEHGDASAIFKAAGQLVFESFLAQQPRELIVRGPVFQFRLGSAPFGDVGHEGAEMHLSARVPACKRKYYGKFRSVGSDSHDFDGLPDERGGATTSHAPKPGTMRIPKPLRNDDLHRFADCCGRLDPEHSFRGVIPARYLAFRIGRNDANAAGLCEFLMISL